MKTIKNRAEILRKVADKLSHKTTKKFPEFKSGDTVKVFVNVREGEKTRVQPFEGIVIKKRAKGIKASFTVRKIASGIGVERTFPINSPVIDRIMLVSKGEVRRAKLYYMRGLRGRKGRIRSEYVYEDTQSLAAEASENTESAVEKEDSENVTKEAAQA